MKRFFIYILAGLLFSVQGCVKDTGNYSYVDAEGFLPKILSGFDTSFEVTALDYLIIDPEIGGNEEDFEYTWYVFSTTLGASSADTLGRSRKLEYQVTLPGGSYWIGFKVENKATKIASFARVGLTVYSPFGNGYLVLKEVDGMTDIDYINRGSSVMSPDILLAINGERQQGAPITLAFHYSYSYEVSDADGRVEISSGNRAIMIASEGDLCCYLANDMCRIKQFEDLFLEVPAVKKPQSVAAGATTPFLVLNDDKAHMITASTSRVGKFGYSYVGDYHLDPKRFYSSVQFDKTKGGFLTFTTNYTIADYTHGYPSFDLIYKGNRAFFWGTTGLMNAIITNRETGENHLLSSVNTDGVSLLTVGADFVLPNDFEVNNAKVYATGGYYTDVVYYSNGDNKVGYYNYINQTENRSVITLPDGERVVYLQHIYDMMEGSLSFVMVLTNHNGGWTLRCYDTLGMGPEMATTPPATWSGEGNAKKVLFRHANTMYMNVEN